MEAKSWFGSHRISAVFRPPGGLTDATASVRPKTRARPCRSSTLGPSSDGCGFVHDGSPLRHGDPGRAQGRGLDASRVATDNGFEFRSKVFGDADEAEGATPAADRGRAAELQRLCRPGPDDDPRGVLAAGVQPLTGAWFDAQRLRMRPHRSSRHALEVRRNLQSSSRGHPDPLAGAATSCRARYVSSGRRGASTNDTNVKLAIV